MTTPTDFSVYLHLPYCVRRCTYCDFNTYARDDVPEDEYTSALLREMDLASNAAEWGGRKITTVFFGGGTPSLFAPAAIGRMLEGLDQRFGLTQEAEITLEANPGTLEGGGTERLTGYRSVGVNRLSLGIQSFDAARLALLGRLHSAEDARAALTSARKAGFDNVSCDLIFGIPGQTLAAWEEEIDALMELAPDHVSAYGLTYEPGTVLTRQRDGGEVRSATEDLELAMFVRTEEQLGTHGFERYEISNFAQPGRRSRHNCAYWTWSDYLGLGAGAHGFAAERQPDRRAAGVWGRRYRNRRRPEDYMEHRGGSFGETVEELDREAAVAEYFMLGLRLMDGIDLGHVEELFSIGIEEFAATARPLIDQSSLVLDERAKTVRLSAEGLRLADGVITELAAALAKS